MKRWVDWLVQTWPGRLVAVAVPLAVSVLTGYFLNRIASFDYDRLLHTWEFYLIVALVVLTATAATIEQGLRAGAERRRKEKIGSAEIHQTRNFAGREDELAAIQASRTTAASAVVICGPRGIGKSVLAREYAYRNRKRFSLTWWFNAKTEDGIIDGLLSLGAYLRGASSPVADRRAAAELVRNELADLPKPALLVFDDLEAEALLWWKPESGAMVVATSNKSAATWSADVATMSLGLWSADEAAQYLWNECKSRGMTADEADELARTLGRLPLALSHAAAYLRGTAPATVRGYIEHLTEHLAEVPPGAEYPDAVFATFQESVSRAEQDAPGAAAILFLAAFFAPDTIPIELFQQDPDVYPDGLRPVPGPRDMPARDLRSTLLDATTFEKALGALDRFSLVAFFREARVMTVHRLVQLVARAALGHDSARWAEAAVAALDDVFPSVDSPSSSTCERFLRHACVALDTMPEDTTFAPAAWLALGCGDCLAGRAALSHAELLYRRALEIFETADGTSDATLLIALRRLGRVLYQSARLPQAEQVLRRALLIAETSFGRDDPEVASALNSLAGVIRDRDLLSEAEALYLRALAINEAYYGPDDPRVATSLDNLANVVSDRGEFAEAERLYRRSLAIREARYGSVDPRVAITLSNLAILLTDTGRLTDAGTLHRRALAIQEATYGPDHFDVATTLHNLAITLCDTKQWAEAERLERRALAIYEATYGPDHPEVATTLVSIADILSETNRLAGAEELDIRALAIFEATYGPDDHRVAATLNNLANLLARTNRPADAERLYRRSLRIEEMVYGSDHPKLTTILNNLAGLMWDTNPEEAEQMYRRAVTIREAIYGPNDPRTVRTRDALASLLRKRPQP